MKIPHDHSEIQDISLKIGRYRYVDGKPECSDPKSELTLENEELNALLEYVSNNYTPVSLGAGEYVEVSGGNAQLIKQFKSLIDTQYDAASLLIETGILSQNILFVATAIQKQNALVEFEDRLKEDLPERYWQEWFSNNKWVLGSDFAQILDDRHIDTENIADYIMQAYDGFADLVEIKKPNGMPFWASAKDHDNYVPSTELIRAITQCLNYLHAIEQEANSAKFIERIGSKVIKPRCILVFGRSSDWDNEKKEAFRILNAAYNQVTILTYDHLLSRAKNVLGLSEPPDDEEADDELPF